MYSEVVNGKVLDFHYNKINELLPSRRAMVIYNFRIGDIFIGQIFKLKSRKWCAVPFVGTAVYGFASRYDASEYLLQLRRKDGG